MLSLEKDFVNLTPAEASGSPIAAKYEGRLGINPENERALVDFKGGQKNAKAKLSIPIE